MLEARALGFRHRFKDPPLLEGFSLRIAPGEVVGLRGPSGVGKSTLGKLLTGHLAPTAGTVTVDDQPLPRQGFRSAQMLFQHAERAVNARWRVAKILNEAWACDPATADAFGVEPRWADRFPHELSGGQLRRVTIVRALAPGLRYLVCDEPTASLDAIAQADIWRAMLAVARVRRIGLLVVSHDAALLAAVAERVVEMTAPLRGR